MLHFICLFAFFDGFIQWFLENTFSDSAYQADGYIFDDLVLSITKFKDMKFVTMNSLLIIHINSIQDHLEISRTTACFPLKCVQSSYWDGVVLITFKCRGDDYHKSIAVFVEEIYSVSSYSTISPIF